MKRLCVSWLNIVIQDYPQNIHTKVAVMHASKLFRKYFSVFVTLCVAMRARDEASQKSVKVLLILIKDEKGAGSSQSHPLSLWELGGGESVAVMA